MQRENVRCYKKDVIPNLIWNLQREVVSQDKQQRQAWKMLNQVQHDGLFHKGGFTLIELLVVVLIIGILAAVALPQYNKAVLKSRLATTMSGVKTIAQAAEVYYLANGEYPPDDMTALDISELSGCTPSVSSGSYSWLNCGNIRYDYNAGGNEWHITNQQDRVDGLVGKLNSDNTFTTQVTYIQYLNHSPTYAGERHCYVSDASTLSHQVCKSLGGELITAKIYRLP